MSASQEERKTANSSEESEQFTDDDDLPELVTDSDSDLENNKLPELGAGNEDNKPKPAPRRAPPPARRHRELKLPELPTGKPPPRRRFTKGTVPLPEVRKSQLRPVSPVDPSAPAAVDTF
jgi:hypothetical protein